MGECCVVGSTIDRDWSRGGAGGGESCVPSMQRDGWDCCRVGVVGDGSVSFEEHVWWFDRVRSARREGNEGPCLGEEEGEA